MSAKFGIQIEPQLGFKRSPRIKELDSVDLVSPPTFHDVRVSPKLPKEYALFDSMIRYVVRKEDEESFKVLCMWIAGSSEWRNPGFYESWRILRREQETRIGEEPKFRDIAKILDAALLEYIMADHKPNVDLQSAFNDYLVFEDAKMVIREIKRGKYKRPWSHRRRDATRPKVGSLYGEREKAWRMFLDKRYPNLEKPIKDGKLLKGILGEFAQYWKREYWEEKSRRSR